MSELKKHKVQCPHCQAALRIIEGNHAFQCPHCNKLFRMRIKTKLTKDVTPDVVETYVNVKEPVFDESLILEKSESSVEA